MTRLCIRVTVALTLLGTGWAAAKAQTTAPDFEFVVDAPGGLAVPPIASYSYLNATSGSTRAARPLNCRYAGRTKDGRTRSAFRIGSVHVHVRGSESQRWERSPRPINDESSWSVVPRRTSFSRNPA